jgi:hypothetical protein
MALFFPFSGWRLKGPLQYIKKFNNCQFQLCSFESLNQAIR